MLAIKDFVLDCLLYYFKDNCLLNEFNILIKLEKVQIPILLFYYVFADYSNYINEKKKEINEKQEKVRKLNEEVVEYIEASCQGREKDILRVPGVVGCGTGYSVFLRGNLSNFLGNILTPMKS